MMNQQQTDIWREITKELNRQKSQVPHFPVHVAGQSGVVCSYAGDLMREALSAKYGKGKKGADRTEQQKRLRAEAVRVAASAIRFVENLK
jgi:cation transport regulator ChaB